MFVVTSINIWCIKHKHCTSLVYSNLPLPQFETLRKICFHISVCIFVSFTFLSSLSILSTFDVSSPSNAYVFGINFLWGWKLVIFYFSAWILFLKINDVISIIFYGSTFSYHGSSLRDNNLSSGIVVCSTLYGKWNFLVNNNITHRQ